MRRNIKNDKVLRAITIGLATMIAATSMPMNVYAESESNTEDPGTEASGTEGGEQTTPASEPTPKEAVEAMNVTDDEIQEAGQTLAPQVQDAKNTAGQASTDLETAHEAVAGDNGLVQQNEIKTDLENAKSSVDDVVKDLSGFEADDNMKKSVAKATKAVAEADTAIMDKDLDYSGRTQYIIGEDEEGNAFIKPQTDEEGNILYDENGKIKYETVGRYHFTNKDWNINGDLSFDNAYSAGITEAESAFTALDTDDIDAATAALEKLQQYYNTAFQKLGVSGEKLVEAQKKYAVAEEAVKQSEEAVKKAIHLSDDIKSTEAAEKYVKAAQEKMDRLTNLKNQSYATMVAFYEKLGCAVKNADGSLNITESAKKAVSDLMVAGEINENSETVETADGVVQQVLNVNGKLYDPQNLGDNVYKVGREYLRQLVIYNILEKNPTLKEEDIHFAEKENGLTAKGAQKVTISTNNGKEAITRENTADQYWNYQKDDSGRFHRVKVTYTDASGQTVVKYYNYAVKAAKYDGTELDLENGVVFVSELYQDEKGNWQHTNLGDPKTAGFLDNYQKLVTAEAKHAETKQAVDAAAEQVFKIRDEINKIGNVGVNKDKLGTLKTRLTKAQWSYEYGQTCLKDLQKLIDTIKAKLDRPPVSDDDTTGGDTTPTTGGDEDPGTDDTTGGDTTPSTGGATYDVGTGTLTIPGYEIPPITLPTTPSGVAGVRAAATRPSGVLGVKAPETKAEKTIANKTVVKPAAKKTVAQKGKKIADPETPLAATPFVDEDGMKIPWIWLLIIAALGAVGKKMYDEHKKKVQAEEQAKKYND